MTQYQKKYNPILSTFYTHTTSNPPKKEARQQNYALISLN